MRPLLPIVRKVACGAAVLVATLVLGVVLSTPSATVAAEPKSLAAVPDDLQHSVEELVRELDAPTRARREKALAGLRELGPRILPLLPDPRLVSSAAAADSVKQLRGELERQQARLSIQASRATLQGSRAFGEWIRELARQTRNPVDSSGLPAAISDRFVRLELKDVEFWTALDQLARTAGLSLALTPGNNRMKLQASEKGSRASETPAVTSGAFRVSADPAQVRKIFGAADRKLIRVPLKIQPEPRLRPLFLHYSAAEISARTAPGNELPPMSPEGKYEVPLMEGGQEVSLPVDFVIPTTRPNEISLQGKVWFTTAANQEPIRFVGLRSLRPTRGREIARRRGGVTVALRKVTWPKEGEARELHIEVAVTYDTGGPAFESHRNWIMHNAVYLETPDGKRLPLNGGTETKLEGDGAIRVEYRFVRLPEPLPDYSFVYVAPTLIIDAPVEFRLESIPVRKP